MAVTASARSAARAAWISGSEIASRATDAAVELSKIVARAHTATTVSMRHRMASTPHTTAAVGRTQPWPLVVLRHRFGCSGLGRHNLGRHSLLPFSNWNVRRNHSHRWGSRRNNGSENTSCEMLP